MWQLSQNCSFNSLNWWQPRCQNSVKKSQMHCCGKRQNQTWWEVPFLYVHACIPEARTVFLHLAYKNLLLMLHMPVQFCFLLRDEQMWAFGFSKPHLWDTSDRDCAQTNTLQTKTIQPSVTWMSYRLPEDVWSLWNRTASLIKKAKINYESSYESN